jgi:hypothetical protein
MKQLCDWKPTTHVAPCTGRCYVTRNGQLGFPKGEYICHEKLASDLARSICVPVPLVELGTVNGEGTWAISHVHSLRSRPLRKDSNRSNQYSAKEIEVLKTASGLIAFYVRIGATDNKDSNLIVDDLGESRTRIVAIDFEHAFNFLGGRVAPPPPGLLKDFDAHIVTTTLERIETLAQTEIEGIAGQCFDKKRAGEIADALNKRRKRWLRQTLQNHGWLSKA